MPLDAGELPRGVESLSAQACGTCHPGPYRAWSASALARSARDPGQRRAAAALGDPTACHACHLPLVQQHPRLAAEHRDGDLARPELQPNPSWDPGLQAEGVNCAACHLRDGAVLGPRPAPEGSPHPVVQSSALSEPAFCGTCHRLSLPDGTVLSDTLAEWRDSPYAAAGVRCQDCHMPPVAQPVRVGRLAAAPEHAFRADPRLALSVHPELPSPTVHRGQPYAFTVRFRNTGAGHALPTGSPWASLELSAGLYRGDEPLVEPARLRLAQEREPEPPFRLLRDERLAPGQERALSGELTVPQKIPAGLVSFRVLAARDGREAITLLDLPLELE